MGMDISIWTDKGDGILGDNHPENFLSRTFAGLFTNGELRQFSQISSVNMSAINEMEEYDEDFDWLDCNMPKSERDAIIQKIKKDNERCNNNIDRVLETVDNLVIAIPKIKNLPEIINKNEHKVFDTERNIFYFSDFQLDKYNDDFGNNFGFDLRIFQRFVAYAKEKGATMVYFIYM